MALTQEQSEKFQKWMNEKCTQHACPSCGQNNWALGQIIMANTVTEGGGVSIGGGGIPMVQICCSNCAFVKLYATVPIGL